MALFERYKLEREGNGYNVILYLNPALAEFADEFGKNNDAADRLEDSVRSFVKERFPNLRVKAAKIMIGSMLAASIPIGGAALAAPPDQPPAVKQQYEVQTVVNFKDVEGTKYESAVEMLQSLGVISGFEDETYRPGEGMTRAQFAKFAVYAAGYGPTAELLGNQNTGFKDVPDNNWASRYVQVAKNAGLMQGVGNNNFNPNAQVTYEQVVTVLQRIQGYKDDHMLGTYPTNHVIQATQQGITSNTDFKVGQQANRGDVAILLRNILEKNKVEFDSKAGRFVTVDDDATLLEKVFDLNTGIVETDRDGVFHIAPIEGSPISTENINITLVGGKGLGEFLGHDVVFKRVNDNHYLLIDKQDPRKVKAGSVAANIDFTKQDATVRLQFKDTGARYEFASNPIFYFNGQRLADRPDQIKEGQSVTVYLNDQNKIRYVNINDYKTPFVVSEVIGPTDVLNGALRGVDKSGPVRYTIDKDRPPKVVRDGTSAALSDITKHDVIYAVINDEGNVTRIDAYSNIVTGTVTKVKEGRGKYVQIDGKDYQLSEFVLPDSDDLVVTEDGRDPEYIVGAKYSLVLDKDGKVIKKFTPAGADPAKVTGMFLGADEVSKVEDGKVLRYSAVNILTTDGTEKTFLVSRDKGITSRVVEGAGDTYDLFFRTNNKEFTISNQYDEPVGAGETPVTADLMTLTLDENGLVVSIDPILQDVTGATGAHAFNGFNKGIADATGTHVTIKTAADKTTTYRYADNLVIYDQVNKKVISKDTFRDNFKNYKISYVLDNKNIYVNKIIVTSGVDKADTLKPVTGIYQGHYLARGDDGSRNHYVTLKIGNEERDFLVADNFNYRNLAENTLVTISDQEKNDAKYDLGTTAELVPVTEFTNANVEDRTFTINGTNYFVDEDTQVYVVTTDRNGNERVTLSDFSAINSAAANFDPANPNVKASAVTKTDANGAVVKYGEYTVLNSIMIDQR